MATNRTVTVKTSGGDYTSLAAAIAGEDKNLVSLDRQLTIECYAKQDTSAVYFTRTAWTTDATRYILVTCPSTERHSGIYSTSKYRLEVSNNTPFRIDHGVFITVEWLQIHLVTGTDMRVVYFGGATASASNITLRNCIVRSYGGAQYNAGIHASYTGNSSSNIYVYNNLVYGGDTVNNVHNYGLQSDIVGNYYFFNNTIISRYGVKRNNGTFILKNNLFQVVESTGTGTMGAGTNYNRTNLSSLGYTVTGGGNTSDATSQTFTFVDSSATPPDFHLASNDAGAKNLGVSDPGSGLFSNDIDGQTRYGSWDVGADEIISTRRIFVIS